MKKTSKRLLLNRETLLRLSPLQQIHLEQVQGGAANSAVCTWGCVDDSDWCNIQTQ